MAAELIKTLLLSWMLTVLIESLSAFLAGLRGRRNYGLLFLVNTFTNPLAVLLVYVLYRYTPLLMLPAQIIVEAAVFLTEGLIFRQCVDSENAETVTGIHGSCLLSLILFHLQQVCYCRC